MATPGRGFSPAMRCSSEAFWKSVPMRSRYSLRQRRVEMALVSPPSTCLTLLSMPSTPRKLTPSTRSISASHGSSSACSPAPPQPSSSRQGPSKSGAAQPAQHSTASTAQPAQHSTAQNDNVGTGQGRAGQGRAGQGRAGQERSTAQHSIC